MSEPGSRSPQPNVVPPDAAARIRTIGFDCRDLPVIDPLVVAERLIEDGHGAEFPDGIRRKRVHTWVKQVFRRLRKQGWLVRRTDAEWIPTDALRSCQDVEALTRKASAGTRNAPAPREVEPASEPEPSVRPTEPEPEPPSSEPAPVESWPGYIESWVLSHRDAPFCIGDLVADMISEGFGSGTPKQRMDSAKKLAKKTLRELESEYLLERETFWRATELLRDWPSA